MKNFKNLPIFINNRERLTTTRKLVTWLLETGHTNIFILDNASTYPPLLQYYKEIARKVRVLRLCQNYGFLAFWHSHAVHLPQVPFVLTDSDILPTEQCPDNVIEVFYSILQRFPNKLKVGFGLRIDDLPDHYDLKAKVLSWEAQFWRKPLRNDDLPCSLFDAAIDTTFALYRRPVYDLDAIRTGAPYLARHLPWYVNSRDLTDEDVWVENNTPKCGTWRVSDGLKTERGIQASDLHKHMKTPANTR